MSSGFRIALLLIGIVGVSTPVQSLDGKPLHARDAAPNMPRVRDTIPERMPISDPVTTGSTRAPHYSRTFRQKEPGSYGRTRGGLLRYHHGWRVV